jgi:transposase
LKDIQADDPSLPLRYWCQDETRIGLKTVLGRRLTSKGIKPIAQVQWPRKAIWLDGIVSPATGESFFLEYSHLDKICFEHFLQQIAQEFPQYLNVIQVDGASAHIAQDIEIPDNIVLLFQPAHSPELNPIERFWLDLKIDLRGVNFSNLDELRLTIRQILEYMTPEWIASLTGYPFILRALSDALIT